MNPIPTISIIIPTYNRCNRLPRLIQILSKQTYRDFEAIVVNNGSTDNTAQLLQDFSRDFRFLRFSNQPQLGRAGARNFGAGLSTAPLLIFLDDDMIPENSWLEKHHTFHIQHPGSVLVGNSFRNPGMARSDFDAYLIHIEKGWKKNTGLFPVSHKYFTFTACNLSLPRSLFDSTGKFDARLDDGEDYVFGRKLLELKIPIFCDSRVLAWHDDFPDAERFLERLIQYKKANQKIIQLYPELQQYLVSSAQRPIAILLKKFLRKAGVSKLILTLIHVFEPVPVFPRSLKFFLYKSYFRISL